MKKSPLLILSVLLAACGRQADFRPAVAEQAIPRRGSEMPGERFDHLGRRNTGLLLETGKSEKCHAVVQSLAQFDLRASADQLQLGGCPIRNSGPGTLASSPETNRTARA